MARATCYCVSTVILNKRGVMPDIVVQSLHLQILLQARKPRISNVGAVEKAQSGAVSAYAIVILVNKRTDIAAIGTEAALNQLCE